MLSMMMMLQSVHKELGRSDADRTGLDLRTYHEVQPGNATVPYYRNTINQTIPTMTFQ